jgi:hypothetical protein
MIREETGLVAAPVEKPGGALAATRGAPARLEYKGEPEVAETALSKLGKGR